MSTLDYVRYVHAPASVATLILAATVALSAQRVPAAVFTFDADAAGQPPAGFLFAEAREALAGRWTVKPAEATQVLVHTGDAVNGRGAALAVVKGQALQEGELSVRVRMLDGERSAGLVWRYKDPRNYHMVQFTLGEQSIALYRVVDGNRVRLENEDDLELDSSAWHALRVVQRSRSVRVYLGGIRVFEDRDRTTDVAGAVGFWCAGNTTAQFDDFRVVRAEEDQP
jgi:hypothetical protein